MVIFFVCLLPVRLLLSSMAVLYYVSNKMQKAYSCGLFLIAGRMYLWLSAALVSWDLTGTGLSEIAVELELSWLFDPNDHLGLGYVLPAPPCWSLDWHADFDG